MTNKDVALSYLEKGFSVIPLVSPPMASKKLSQEEFIRKCKTPLLGWKEFQSRHPTVEEVTGWFTKWPDASIGIVTGKISNLIVFDLDSEHAVKYAEDEGGFPDTPKVITGKGSHAYMRYPGFEVRNDVRKELDIDIRGDGGYVVAPPSIHGNGNQYTWEEGFSIFKIDPAPCEQWMLDYLKDVANSSSKPAKEKIPKPSESPDTVKKAATGDTYANILANGAQEGQRNHTATKLIGHLLGKGNDEAVVWEMVKTWNAAKNNPPLDALELRKSFDSISKRQGRNGKKEKKKEKKSKKVIKIDSFLDTPEKVVAAYNNDYVRIPIDIDGNFQVLQKKMNGGLIGGRLYILGGIPSSGKTAMVNNLADNICLSGMPVMIFSYDDGADELRYRTYARFSGFDIENFNQNVVPESDIKAILNNERIKIISSQKYVVPELINTEDWPNLIDQVIARHNKPPVIIADYLRKLRLDDKQASERAHVDEILSCLTNMAKTYNTPILVLSELARDSYKSGQRLSMASGKESGSIEYEASWLGILASVEQDGAGYTVKQDWESIIQQDGNVDLIVFKAKRGTGERGKIALKMNIDKMTFRDRIEERKTDNIQHLKKSKYA
jgi:replicative DNA helicase